MTRRFSYFLSISALALGLCSMSVSAAPKFLEAGKVYRFMPTDDDEVKSMLVVETDPKSDWIRVKPVDKATDKSVWINLDAMSLIQPIQ